MSSLRAKVAIVSGAANGIGRAIAQRLAADGARVAVADIDEVAGERVAAEIRQAGGSSFFRRTDVTDPDEVTSLVRHTLKCYGRLDALVNNAGGLTAPGGGSEVFLELSPTTFDADLRLNLTGPFLLAQSAVRVMESGAVVINVSSINALVAIDSPAYSAAKAGLLALTRHIACFHSPKVRSVAVALGTIGTETVLAHWRRRRGGTDALSHWYPMERIGFPEEVGALVSFLASDEAPFLNGCTITVDGGLSCGIRHFGKHVA
jgi:NAD(P)-dependent dehydrogenase (short-subunit alcohol dehydrogenase family)